MTRYLVTTELKTPWYLKVLRVLKLIKPREEFFIYYAGSYGCEVGEILCVSQENRIKIIEEIKQREIWKN